MNCKRVTLKFYFKKSIFDVILLTLKAIAELCKDISKGILFVCFLLEFLAVLLEQMNYCCKEIIVKVS